MASQLGSVTVSAVPDEQSGEVGGLQNTGTQLGASIGTALAGAVLISALTASFFTGVQNNPAVPDNVVSRHRPSSAAASRSCPTRTSKPRSRTRTSRKETADAIDEDQRRAASTACAPRSPLLALLALALLFTRGIPTVQPGAEAKPNAPPVEAALEAPTAA